MTNYYTVINNRRYCLSLDQMVYRMYYTETIDDSTVRIDVPYPNYHDHIPNIDKSDVAIWLLSLHR